MRAQKCLAGLALTAVTAASAVAGLASAALAEVGAGVSLGGGQRGDETYAGVEARLDASWEQLRLGLALRGQWDDGRWRDDDFTTAAGWGSVLRYLETWHRWDDGELAAALGALRPASVGRVSDGVQASVDDRYHTGLRARGRGGALELAGEIDDLFAPRFFAAEAGWHLGDWRAGAAAAIGAAPWGDASQMGGAAVEGEEALATESAFELSLSRRFLGKSPKARGGRSAGATRRAQATQIPDEARLGLGLVGEPGEGLHAVGFAAVETRAGQTRLSLRADLRLGTGSLGLAFGPFHRVLAAPSSDSPSERSSSDAGLGAGLGLRVERQGLGWFEGSLRTAQDRRAVATAYAGVPITSRGQAGAWVATEEAGRTLFAGEVRAFGRAGSFAAVEASHLVRQEAPAMGAPSALATEDPALGWAIIGWVGVSR
jgi:hypothetical protein